MQGFSTQRWGVEPLISAVQRQQDGSPEVSEALASTAGLRQLLLASFILAVPAARLLVLTDAVLAPGDYP